MYIENEYHGRVPDFDLEKIGKIIETREDGTYPDKVLNLNKVKDVFTSLPSVEFEVTLKRHTLNEINEEINNNQPPIAWIRLTEKGDTHKCAHAVVVTYIDIKNNWVSYNDPISGEINEPLDVFQSNWEYYDSILIKVKIGKKPQRILEEFPKEEKPVDEQGGGRA
jgi:hypothetical protein